MPRTLPNARRFWRLSACLCLVAVCWAAVSLLPVPLQAAENPGPVSGAIPARFGHGLAQVPVVMSASLRAHHHPADAQVGWSCVESSEDKRSLEPDLSDAPPVRLGQHAAGLTATLLGRILQQNPPWVPPAPHSARSLARFVSLLS